MYLTVRVIGVVMVERELFILQSIDAYENPNVFNVRRVSFHVTIFRRGRTPVRPAHPAILRDAQRRVPYIKDKFPVNTAHPAILRDAQGRVPYIKDKFPVNIVHLVILGDTQEIKKT